MHLLGLVVGLVVGIVWVVRAENSPVASRLGIRQVGTGLSIIHAVLRMLSFRLVIVLSLRRTDLVVSQW